MTSRLFYQRSVKTNLKFGILIFVIVLSARFIECDDEPTEAPAGGEGEATGDGGTAEPDEADQKIEGVECEELTKPHDKCPDDAETVITGYMDKHCIINVDDIPQLCKLIGFCSAFGDKLKEIFKNSVVGTAADGFIKRNETDALSCAGHSADGNGQMLYSSLWLIFGVVGGLMIYSSRYD